MTAVSRGLSALRGRWLRDSEIVAESGRQNPNGIARDCREAALRQGLCWHYISVNEESNGPGRASRRSGPRQGRMNRAGWVTPSARAVTWT